MNEIVKLMVKYKGVGGGWLEFSKELSRWQMTGRPSCYTILFIIHLFIEVSFSFYYFSILKKEALCSDQQLFRVTYGDQSYKVADDHM